MSFINAIEIATISMSKEKVSFKKYLGQFWRCFIVAVSIAIVTIIVYQPILFNFFINNDFGVLAWLKAARNDISLVGQHFYGHWLYNQPYYRPLTSMIWFIEYFIWGANGIGFRWISIVILLLTSVLLGLITFEISKQSMIQSSHSVRVWWSILSAALFALYPLHTEPIVVCFAQHDAIVTFFCLLSFWCYLRWHRSSSKAFLFLSLCSMALGLLCKEMAVTLPFILSSYELLCCHKSVHSSSRIIPVDISKTSILRKVRVTSPYWLVLAAYFCLRKVALGTFTGNPPFVLHTKQMETLRAWIHSLQQIFVPIDFSFIAKNNPLVIIWGLSIILIVGLSVYAFRVAGRKRLCFFLIAWFILCLVPAYQVFIINFGIEGTRFPYLSTAPLCIFLTYGIANFSYGFKYSALARAASGALIILSAFILYCNNQACALLGHLSNRVIEELQRYYQSIPDDPQVQILGLPPSTIGTISGMTKMPFLKRDIFNCNGLNYNVLDMGPIPFGFLKEAISQKESKITFLYWDRKNQAIKPVVLYPTIPEGMKMWQGSKLKSIINIISNSSTKATWENGKVLHIVSDKQACLQVNLEGLPCWPTDFINFRIQMAPEPDKGSPVQFDLRFLNDIGQITLGENIVRGLYSLAKKSHQPEKNKI